ncbi:hypothetical protein D3C87_1543810 [compost metagenome]
MLGHGLDIHAAFGGDHEGDARGGAIDQQRTVELAGDIGTILDIEAVDLLAGGAGLLGHQRIAEHFAGIGDDVFDRLGEAHAALGIGPKFLELALAAAAGMDLALDHIERAGQRLGSGLRFVSRENGNALGNRRAIFLQQRLGLVFMDIHRFPLGWADIHPAFLEPESQKPLAAPAACLVTPASARSSCTPRSGLPRHRPTCRTPFARQS